MISTSPHLPEVTVALALVETMKERWVPLVQQRSRCIDLTEKDNHQNEI